jgi:3-isopropylmalate/(R)-2-methylmalate dehydratase small subunit
LVIAESFARIFKQNMFNCGMMAIELPFDTINRIFNVYAAHQTFIETDMDHSKLHIKKHGQKEEISFSISDFERVLVGAGGWLEYAESKY